MSGCRADQIVESLDRCPSQKSGTRVILRRALSLASRGRLSILVFHRVLSQPDALLPSEPSAAEFEALLLHVKARYTVISLLDGVQGLSDGSLPQNAVAITLDDGYANNLTIAAPILHRHGIRATVFVATGYLDGGCMFNDLVIEAIRGAKGPSLDLSALGLDTYGLQSVEDRRMALDRILDSIKYLALEERDRRAHQILALAKVAPPNGMMLTRASVQRLAQFGLDVGGHTISHPILAKAPADAAWAEIRDGKNDLEDLLGREVALFAYPNGRPDDDYRPEHVQMVKNAGFKAAVTGAWGAAKQGSDVFQLPRFTPWTRRPLKFDLLMLRNLRQHEQKAA